MRAIPLSFSLLVACGAPAPSATPRGADPPARAIENSGPPAPSADVAAPPTATPSGAVASVGPSASSAPKAPRVRAPGATTHMVLVPAAAKVSRYTKWQGGFTSPDPAEPPFAVAAFWMDKYEITVTDYRACREAGECGATETKGVAGSTDDAYALCNEGRPGRERHPINCVSFRNARAYCAFVGKRLPTETEFIYAGRGTDGRPLPWGDTNRPVRCWDRLPGTAKKPEGTCAVDAFPNGASPFGVLGLADNVREWVLTPAEGRQVIGIAGGSWFSSGENVGLSVSGGGTVDDGPRDVAGAGWCDHRVGFRCARDP